MVWLMDSIDKGFLPKGLPFYAQQPEKLPQKRYPSDLEFKDMIRQMGLKFTPQRLVILKVIFSYDKKHITAQALFETLSEKSPHIGFATVYRFLRVLTQHGRMIEVRMGAMPARYELTPRKHHDHLTCIYCGHIVEFEDDKIEKLQDEVCKKNKFQLVHHILELYGVCSSSFCQKQHKSLHKS